MVNVSFQLSLAALKLAQESAAAVAQQLAQTPSAGEFTEDLVELLVAGDVHEANVRAVRATNEMLGDLIDILA